MNHSTTCSTLVRNGPCTCEPAALQLRTRGATLWCQTCRAMVRQFPFGTVLTIAQLILAEQQHRETAHPAAEPDYQGVHDAVVEDDE